MWLNLKIIPKISPEWNDQEILLSIIDYIDILHRYKCTHKHTWKEGRKGKGKRKGTGRKGKGQGKGKGRIFFYYNALSLFKYSRGYLPKIRPLFHITIIQPSHLGNQHSYSALFQFTDFTVILPIITWMQLFHFQSCNLSRKQLLVIFMFHKSSIRKSCLICPFISLTVLKFCRLFTL